MSPFHDLIDHGSLKDVAELLRCGLDPNRPLLPSLSGKETGQAEAVAEDEAFCDPLLLLAIESGRRGIVRLLIKHGADVYTGHADVCTPLHEAASIRGRAAIARTLLKKGASPHAVHE